MTDSPTNIQEKLQALEADYTKLSKKNQADRDTLHKSNDLLIDCMRTLMPIQNAYLTDIIKTLHKQLAEARGQVTSDVKPDTGV
jgi:hypothetical protein